LEVSLNPSPEGSQTLVDPSRSGSIAKARAFSRLPSPFDKGGPRGISYDTVRPECNRRVLAERCVCTSFLPYKIQQHAYDFSPRRSFRHLKDSGDLTKVPNTLSFSGGGGNPGSGAKRMRAGWAGNNSV